MAALRELPVISAWWLLCVVPLACALGVVAGVGLVGVVGYMMRPEGAEWYGAADSRHINR